VISIIRSAQLRLLVAGLVCSGFLFAAGPAAGTPAGDGVGIVIDGRVITIPAGDQPAFIMGDRTYVPLRVVSENLGAQVTWDAQNRRVIINTAGSPPAEPPGRAGERQRVQIVVNGQVKEFPPDYGEPFITGLGRTVVPCRAVGEALGCLVFWNETARRVEITPPPPPPVSRGGTRAGALFQELAGYRTNLRLLDGTLINSAELLDLQERDFSAAELAHLQTLLAQLRRYDREIRLPDGTVIATDQLTIRGLALATADQLRAWIAAETPRIRAKMERELGREFLPIPDLAELYLRIGAEYGIRGDLAFAQAAKETHFWQFTGLVQPYQNNFCGLWATGEALTGEESHNGADPTRVFLQPGVHGAIFATPEDGVEAHIQHLYAYATTDPLPPGKVLLSPRFNLVVRGCAPTWQGLNGRWAVPGTTYGQSIIQDFWLKALEHKQS